MEGPIFLLVIGYLAMPVIAVVVALVARSKASRSSAWLETLEHEVAELRRALDRQQKRLDALEKAGRGDPVTAAPPFSAPQPSQAPAPPPAAPVPSIREPAIGSVPPMAPAPDVPPLQPVQIPAPSADEAAHPPEAGKWTLVGVPVGGTVLPVPGDLLRAQIPEQPPAQAPAMAAVSVRPPAKAVDVVPPVKPPAPPPQSQGTPAPQAPAAAASPARPAVPSRPCPTPPPPRPPVPKEEGGWERRLGIALPVWIGAIALILSGAFLVKYSIEHGMLGHGARVTIATLFGAALLVAGEWLRTRSSMTAQGASAAGVAVLYAAFLAGTVLYKIIAPGAGFGLLLLVTAAAVALSLRQGIVVAVLGLVGGFFTPYFIGAVSASPARLFAYLLLLQGGLLVVTRRRQWTGLSALTLVMGLGAALFRVFGETGVNDALWIGLFLLASAAAFLLSSRGFKSAVPTGLAVQPSLPFGAYLGYASLLGAFIGVAMLAARTRFALEEWLFMGMLAVAAVVLGRMDRAYEKMPWVSFVLVLLLQAGWITQSHPQDRGNVWIVSLGLALVFGLGAWIAQLGASAPARWATLSAIAGLSAFGTAWWVDKLHGEAVEHWGYVSLLGASVYLLAAIRAGRPLRRESDGEEPLAAFCVAVTTFVSFAVPLELSHYWLSVAWALEAAALAWLLFRLKVKALGILGLALGTGVAVRLLLNPSVLNYPLGDLPVLNWILYGYGIPALAFALAAWWYNRGGWERAAVAFAWGSAGLTFALLTLEVRQGFHPGKLLGAQPHLVEWATYSHLWIAAGLVCLWAYVRWRKTTLGYVGVAFLGLAVAKIALIDCVAANPLWNADHVGTLPVFNWLLYAYGLPVAGLVLAAWWLRETDWEGAAKAAAWAAGVIGMVLVAMEVRQGFHTAGLPGANPTLVEWATYSNAYLAVGLLLLLAYRRRWGAILEDVGRAFLVVAPIKIVLVDLLIANPLWAHHDVGSWPVLNWLLYVYGVPALAFLSVMPIQAGTARASKELGRLCQASALVLAAALAFLEVRQFFNPGYLDSGKFTLMEVSTYGHVWLILAALLVLGAERWREPVTSAGAKVLYGLTLGKLLFLDLGICNPLIWHQDVGGLPIVNGLLYVYGLPILGLLGMAILPAGGDWVSIRRLAAFNGGLILGFVLLTLEVRQFFHRPFLDGAPPTDVENYSYSAVWILFALILLVVGIAKHGKAPRVASLVVIFLAVTKVFVYDLRHLQDLYRVGSFMALGLSLLLISFLFQRFVFRETGHEAA